MPDFFARLAGRAADVPAEEPVLRPRLPHLFERPAPAEPVDQVTRPTTASTPAAAPPAAAPPTPAVRDVPAPPPRGVPPTRVDREVVTDRTVTTVESVSAVHHVVERLRLTEGPVLVAPPVVAPTRTSPAPRADAPRAAPVPAGRTVERSRVDTVLPAQRSDLAPQARPRTPEPERVVHISIGRLEVLGARPEPRRPPERPQRPAPLVPLHDYLAGEGGR
jgi:hypothetical protein